VAVLLKTAPSTSSRPIRARRSLAFLLSLLTARELHRYRTAHWREAA
jgi:hypothetical protein